MEALAGKIHTQELWLGRHQLVCDFSKLETNAGRAPDYATLMGVEGSASREYFALWRQLWDKRWGFTERNRRPPRDPVNALLSLGYTLAEHSLGTLVGRYGLEMGVGFLHAPHRGRPSLLLDLLEPVRPWVDEWLWQRVQQGGLTPKHFYSDKELGCRLEKAGRELFFPAWYDEGEAWLQRPMRDSLASLLKRLRHYRYPVVADTE